MSAEVESWMAHPITRLYMRLLKDYIGAEQGLLGSGTTLRADSADYSHAMTHRAVGKISGLSAALDTLRMITEEDENEE